VPQTGEIPSFPEAGIQIFEVFYMRGCLDTRLRGHDEIGRLLLNGKEMIWFQMKGVL
jgi:hypothetical protein